MRISRLIAPTILALTIVACGKDDPTGPTDRELAEAAGANLQTISTKLSDPQAKAAAKAAGFALLNGAPFTEVTVTTTAGPASAPALAINGRPSASIGNATETWAATTMQVVVTNSAAASNGTYNVMVLWKDDTDLIFVGVPDASETATIGTTAGGAFGGLFTSPSSSWQATAGTASVDNSSVGATCTNFVTASGMTCKEAAFTGSFSITNATPYSFEGNTATGTRTASLANRTFTGIQVTVNCTNFGC